MIALSIVLLVLSAIFLGRYLYLRKKEKEQKGFIVILSTILFIYCFPGIAFLVIGVLLLLFLFN